MLHELFFLIMRAVSLVACYYTTDKLINARVIPNVFEAQCFVAFIVAAFFFWLEDMLHQLLFRMTRADYNKHK